MAKKLKALIKTLEEVDEKYRDLYVAADGGFVLDEVETKDWKKQLDEFRNNNIALKQRQEELLAFAEKHKDIDPVKYRDAMAALEQLEKLEDSELIKQGKWEDVIKKRTGTMATTYETQIAGLKQARAAAEENAGKYKNQLSDLLVETHVTKAIGDVGALRKGAQTHLINLARQQWSVADDGTLKGKDLFNEKSEPMTLAEWAQMVSKEHSYLFEPGTGGGAQGGQRGGSKGGNANGVTQIENDPIAIGKNLEAIASGKATVAPFGG